MNRRAGTCGWWFEERDRFHTLAQSTGALNLAPGIVQRWRRVLEYRQAWLAQRGITYLFVVLANRESVCDGNLPGNVALSPDRAIRRLERGLERQYPSLMTYLGPALLDQRTVSSPFRRTDSRWTESAGYAAARLILELVDGAYRGRPGDSDRQDVLRVTFGKQAAPPGNLAPEEPEEITTVRIRQSRARLVMSGGSGAKPQGAWHLGRWEVTELLPAPPGVPRRAVLFHDGDAYPAIGRYLREGFDRLWAATNPCLDFELVERERPDVVLTVVSERSIIFVPDDIASPTTEAWAKADGITAPASPTPASALPG